MMGLGEFIQTALVGAVFIIMIYAIISSWSRDFLGELFELSKQIKLLDNKMQNILFELRSWQTAGKKALVDIAKECREIALEAETQQNATAVDLNARFLSQMIEAQAQWNATNARLDATNAKLDATWQKLIEAMERIK